MSDLNSLIIFCSRRGRQGFLEVGATPQDADIDHESADCELEEALGVRLIERSTRSLRLREVGPGAVYAKERAGIGKMKRQG
jgi:hypothetical protein